MVMVLFIFICSNQMQIKHVQVQGHALKRKQLSIFSAIIKKNIINFLVAIDKIGNKEASYKSSNDTLHGV